MIKKITMAGIEPQIEGGSITTPEIIGRIEKIIVKYAEPSAEEATLEIETDEGESLVAITGSKDGIWYPRNWNVATQMYQGINVASEGQSTMNAERWISTGPLRITYKSSQITDFITKLVIVYEGEDPTPLEQLNPEPEEDFEQKIMKFMKKDAGMVSTGTAGVNNPSHKDKRICTQLTQIHKEIMKGSSKELQKAMGDKPIDARSLRAFIQEAMFKGRFAGMNKTISEQIKEYIIRATAGKYDETRVSKYMSRKAGKEAYTGQFNNIFRTETHELKNNVREWSYMQTDPDGTKLYKWIGPKDHRTTIICERITNRTSQGVTMEELKVILAEEVERAKSEDLLPPDFEPRQWTPHFKCRHTFVRVM